MRTLASDTPRHMRRILRSARQALGMSQTELAEALGSSRRTIIRRERGQTDIAPFQVQRLADLVRAEDPDLADELLVAAGLEPVAVVEMPPAAPVVEVAIMPAPVEEPPKPATPAYVPKQAVEAVLYAAADAIDESPRRIKPAIVAAFARAKEMGLTVEQVVEALDSAK
jgi:transcriptional regulator with XRE-family HTH domain